MFKHFLSAIALIVMCLGMATSLSADETVRLDATSDVTAQQSFDEMFEQASTRKKQALIIAIMKLNLSEVKSVYKVAANPNTRPPSITCVKDRVAGMTVDEIIALADRIPDVKIDVQGE